MFLGVIIEFAIRKYIMGMPVPIHCNDFDENEELEYYRMLFQLGKFDCSYLSYTLERPDGKRFNFFSNKEWLNVYQAENFITTCQLTVLSRQQGNNIIPWNTLYPATSDQKKVLDARADFDIGNGITISQMVNGNCEMIALATRKNNVQFIHNLQTNPYFLQSCLLRLRKIATSGQGFEI